MRNISYSAILLVVAMVGCLSEQTRKDYEQIKEQLLKLEKERIANTFDLHGRFEEQLNLEKMVQYAVYFNPEMHELRHKIYAAVARFKIFTSLDDLQFKVMAEALPIGNPLAFNRDEQNMFGLMQIFPFLGKLDLAGQAALKEADAALAKYRAKERELRANVIKTYFEYAMGHVEKRIHLEHVDLHGEHTKIADARYKTGKVSQQDVIRAQLQLSQLHADVIAIEQKIESAKIMLNNLLSRSQDKTYAEPKEPVFKEIKIAIRELEVKALKENPEIKMAESMVQANEYMLTIAQREATYPDFKAEIDYVQMNRGKDNWDGGVEFHIPWLSHSRHSAEVEEKEALLNAQKSTLASMQNMIKSSVRDSFAKFSAAERSVLLYQTALLPQSEQNVKAARSSYEKGMVDFSTLNEAQIEERMVKMNYFKSLIEYEIQKAELEQLVGKLTHSP